LKDAQQKQIERVVPALEAEKAERHARILQRAQEEAQNAAKRALEVTEGTMEGSGAMKRARTRSPSVPGEVPANQLNVRPTGVATTNQPPFGELGSGIGAYFDTTTLGFELAKDLLVASLSAIDAQKLTAVIHVSTS
jgi:hypothetical protein